MFGKTYKAWYFFLRSILLTNQIFIPPKENINSLKPKTKTITYMKVLTINPENLF